MSFLSLTFLFFFVCLLLLYYRVSQKLKILLLLISSALFYLGFGFNFSILLFAVTLLTFLFSLLVPTLKARGVGKYAMVLAVLIVISPLAFFKYFDFFLSFVADIASPFGLKLGKHALNLMIPVGISFYTFRVLSYLSDVYSGKIAPQRSFIKYALYVSYFPQILCGPIERAGNFFAQIDKSITFKSDNLQEGVKIIIFGLFKKLVIADSLAVYVDSVYKSAPWSSGLSLFVAAIFFSIQIYCDFSGYTDIAKGLSKSLGLDLTENFRRPYLSKNVKEFWGRWHISLSTWLRDYVYIPLGGNRCSRCRKYANIMATFAVSGLWHGANWTFVAWGVLHGIFLIVHDFLFGKNFSAGKTKLPFFSTVFRIALTFAAVSFAWILFRADSFPHFLEIIDGIIFRFNLSKSSILSLPLPFTGDNTSIANFIIAAFFIGVLFADSLIREFGLLKWAKKYDWVYYSFILASTLCFGSIGSSTFIYAQF